MSEAVIITLIGKPDCHLCDTARAVINRVVAAAHDNNLDVELAEVDITTDPAMARKHGEEIPVVLVNGSIYAALEVQEDKLAYAVLHEREVARAKSRRWWRRKK